MTVRDIVSLLKDARDIYISWNGSMFPLVEKDGIMFEAFACYELEGIRAMEVRDVPPESDLTSDYELMLKMAPVRA